MIESTFSSSVEKYVEDFETTIEGFSGSRKAVGTVDGTAVLHADLYMLGVTAGGLVITQV